MNFRRRFSLLLALGIGFSVTMAGTQQSPVLGGTIAMFAVVGIYWLTLHMMRQTIRDLQ